MGILYGRVLVKAGGGLGGQFSVSPHFLQSLAGSHTNGLEQAIRRVNNFLIHKKFFHENSPTMSKVVHELRVKHAKGYSALKTVGAPKFI